MKNMKKSFIVLLSISIVYNFLSINNVKASYLINNNNISISEIEYHNLLNLGFNKTEIMNMKQQEFDENKNLIGQIVSIKETETYDLENLGMVNPRGTSTGYVETTGKKMTTTIVSIGNYYRYKVSLEWKKIPSTRSYDIIGIGKNTNVDFASDIIFQQNYCYSSGGCSSNATYSQYKSSTGGTAIFQLPTSSLSSLSSYMYFNVSKSTTSTITSQKAYGDYSHATKTITLSNAKKHNIGSSGIVLNSDIVSYYDSMSTATSSWTGSW